MLVPVLWIIAPSIWTHWIFRYSWIGYPNSEYLNVLTFGRYLLYSVCIICVLKFIIWISFIYMYVNGTCVLNIHFDWWDNHLEPTIYSFTSLSLEIALDFWIVKVCRSWKSNFENTWNMISFYEKNLVVLLVFTKIVVLGCHY